MSQLKSNPGYEQNDGAFMERDDESAEMMNALMQDMPDFIFFKDIQGRFVAASKNTCSIYSGKTGDMTGKTDFDLLPGSQAEESFLEDKKIMETGEPVRDKIERRVSPEGPELWISVTKAPWRNSRGDIVGIMGICREVTPRIDRERHILDMLSIAMHDIRGPLVSIASTIKLLARGSFGTIDESVKVTLSDISVRINHMEKIVGSYLCKSSLMNIKKPKKEYLDLRQDIIDPILDEFSSEIAENKIKIDSRLGVIPGNSVIIKANIHWIRVVYRNLIRNAIKYAASGKISLGFEDRGDHYRMNVYNSGPAVPEEKRTKIFEQFESRDSTGLGLAISRNLIIKHGGDMWYENTEDNHPNFIFTIPK